MLRYKAFQEILDAVRHDTPLRRSFLGGWIAALELGGEHLMRGHARLMERHAAIRPDGVLAQPRSGASGAVENNEHLAAFRGDLDAEAGISSVPVDYV